MLARFDWKPKKLKELCISDNELTCLPYSIKYLKNLQNLDLSNNTTLRFLPKTIGELSENIILLDLRGCNIQLYNSDENSYGKFKLREIFGNRVIFDNDTVEMERDRITENRLYKNLKKEPIYWNFDLLINIIFRPIPETDLTTENQFLELFDKVLKPDGEICKISDEKYQSLKEFIHHIYNSEEKYSGWGFNKAQHIKLAKNLISEIFKILNDTADMDKITFHTDSIYTGLKFCPYRKIAELRTSYQILISGHKNEDLPLDVHIKEFIAEKKEEVFDFSVTPAEGTQNVHVLNYWRKRLENELGLVKCGFITNLGTMGQDIFRGQKGNALRAFFFNFTPDFIISELTSYINKRGLLQRKALQWLDINPNNISNDQLKKMMIFDEDNEDDEINPGYVTGITVEFARYYLIHVIGVILERNNDRPNHLFDRILAYFRFL